MVSWSQSTLTVPDTLCQASVMVRGLEKHADANLRGNHFEMQFICSFGTLQQDGLNNVYHYPRPILERKI